MLPSHGSSAWSLPERTYGIPDSGYTFPGHHCPLKSHSMPSSTTTSSEKSRIQTYHKMMDVLGCFSSVERKLSLAQIAQAANLPRTTVHRILTALRDIGFIEQDSRGADYVLGVRLFELGSLALANMDLHRESKPFVDRLARTSGEAVHLGVFDGLQVVVVTREDNGDRSSDAANRTESAPAYCTGLGKVMLAFQDKATITRVAKGGFERFTKNTVTSAAELDRELARIRRQGYAIDSGEHQLWINCVAAPIRNATGRVFAAISVTGAAERISPKRYPVLSGQVIQSADAISRQLGYRDA
jgi:DNA-binding IclR family transcriptional regulator